MRLRNTLTYKIFCRKLRKAMSKRRSAPRHSESRKQNAASNIQAHSRDIESAKRIIAITVKLLDIRSEKRLANNATQVIAVEVLLKSDPKILLEERECIYNRSNKVPIATIRYHWFIKDIIKSSIDCEEFFM